MHVQNVPASLREEFFKAAQKEDQLAPRDSAEAQGNLVLPPGEPIESEEEQDGQDVPKKEQ